MKLLETYADGGTFKFLPFSLIVKNGEKNPENFAPKSSSGKENVNEGFKLKLPPSAINLACKIGAGTYLGMGCLIKEGLEIGEEVIIGMSSVVHHNIPKGMIALGNPARPMRENLDKKVFK